MRNRAANRRPPWAPPRQVGGHDALGHGDQLRSERADMPLVVPVWPPGAQTYLGARRRSSGHMMMGRGTPQRGVAAAHVFRAGRDDSPAAVATREPEATSTTGETANGGGLIRRPAPGRRPPVPEGCGSSAG